MVRASDLCLLLLICTLHTATSRPEGVADGDYANDEEYDYGAEDEGAEAGASEPPAPAGPPVITSSPITRSTKPGETVHFPCDIDNLSPNYAVMWLNGSVMVYTDTYNVVDNPRLKSFANHTLQIKNVKPEDSGPYSCKISSDPPVELIHQLLVPSPAQIVKVLPDGDHRTLLLGSALTLDCQAVGHPEPQVIWSKPGSTMPDGKKITRSSIVRIPSLALENAGSYECAATNGMGDGDVRRVTIQVQYGPVVEAMKDVVNSGVGYESELQCKVDALPQAAVSWARNGKPVSSGGHVKVETLGDLHTLRITKTRKEDFATYTCIAQNPVSTQTDVIELTGTPSIAKFITSNSTGNSETLQWVIESHAPITEYTLRYRIRKTNEWRTENPIVEDPMGNQYKVTHTLTNLAPGDYEVRLSSKNSYGLSKESSPQHFNIKDYGEAAQSKVEAGSNPHNNAIDTRPVAALLVSLLLLRTLLQ